MAHRPTRLRLVQWYACKRLFMPALWRAWPVLLPWRLAVVQCMCCWLGTAVTGAVAVAVASPQCGCSPLSQRSCTDSPGSAPPVCSSTCMWRTRLLRKVARTDCGAGGHSKAHTQGGGWAPLGLDSHAQLSCCKGPWPPQQVPSTPYPCPTTANPADLDEHARLHHGTTVHIVGGEEAALKVDGEEGGLGRVDAAQDELQAGVMGEE
jgi:hypothetical protein